MSSVRGCLGLIWNKFESAMGADPNRAQTLNPLPRRDLFFLYGSPEFPRMSAELGCRVSGTGWGGGGGGVGACGTLNGSEFRGRV